MEALILLALGVIVAPILLIILHVSGSKTTGGSADRQAPRHVRDKIRYCPNCGSPVTDRGAGWECGWCGDSGWY